jgi:predicted AAA+ superfamily ATPase
MYKRELFLNKISKHLVVNPVCAILGPRQCGKTTLALQYAKELQIEYAHFDLENPRHRDQIMNNPMLALEDLKGLIILDEVQRAPEIFPILRYLVDHNQQNFLILGSASRDLIHQSSETLAGRISHIELTPFTLIEVKDLTNHWQKGGFPKAFLSPSFELSQLWLEGYISTFLERDLSTIGININPYRMRRLWMMLAHYHGQIVNYSELGKSLGVSHTTIRNYMEILEGTFMIRLLKPWYENISKRQVKSPKIYIRDSGICHYLLDITERTRIGHPKLGALWEGYALEEIIRKLSILKDSFYFWRTENAAEIDLIMIRDNKRIGFEFKYADAHKITRSAHIGVADLKLDHLYLVTPKSVKYKIAEKITAIGLEDLINKDL